jgi:hypothetical protein
VRICRENFLHETLKLAHGFGRLGWPKRQQKAKALNSWRYFGQIPGRRDLCGGKLPSAGSGGRLIKTAAIAEAA